MTSWARRPESSLDGPGLAPARTAIDHILRGHLPYPALVVDRGGELIAANAAFEVLTEGAAPELVGPGTNVYRLALHPRGVAPRIGNLAEWSRHILDRLGHLPDLRDELGEYIPELEPSGDPLGFAVPLHLRSSYGELRLMTTVTTFATAVDITLAGLKPEAFLPADPATQQALATAAAHRDDQEPDSPPRSCPGPPHPLQCSYLPQENPCPIHPGLVQRRERPCLSAPCADGADRAPPPAVSLLDQSRELPNRMR